jgi:hypothetical protein
LLKLKNLWLQNLWLLKKPHGLLEALLKKPRGLLVHHDSFGLLVLQGSLFLPQTLFLQAQLVLPLFDRCPIKSARKLRAEFPRAGGS